MCDEYECHQAQCGQCQQFHGPKNYDNLQQVCRKAEEPRVFGSCGLIIKNKAKRMRWKDCDNCRQRDIVHSMWTNGWE